MTEETAPPAVQQVRVRMLQTAERNVLDAKGRGKVRKLVENTVVTVDALSAGVLKNLRLAEDLPA